MIVRRRAMLALPLFAASGFSGCSNPDVGFLEQVQDAVMRACGFVPLIATILSILNLHDPMLQTVQQIADAICNALSDRQRNRTAPQVKGVAVQGYYVTGRPLQ